MVYLGLCWVIKACNNTASKNLFEVEFLTNICDVNDSVCLQLVCPIADCSHIRSVIVETTIRFTDH